MRFFSLVKAVFLSASLMAGAAHAQDSLITYEGGKVGAGLAKSWKKEGDTKYSFVLDTSKKVDGKPLTPAMAKDNLEGKLGGAVGVKVTEKGKDGIDVSYKGTEENFLKKVAKLRFKATKSVALAMDSSVSDGGIRARTAERDPKDTEIKIRATSITGNNVKGIVVAAGKSGQAAGTSAGKVITVQLTPDFKVQKNDTFFFTPTVLKGNAWQGTGFTKE